MRGRGYAMSNEYSTEEKRLAVLIDADNVSPAYIKVIIDEATARGIVTYKRIYADWTRNEMQGWKSVLLEYSLTPMQQYSYTTGKNSTDSALIIDAMDILYTGRVEGFCLVSSDSDFTRLADLTKQQEAVQQKLDEMVDRWAYLSELAEAEG